MKFSNNSYCIVYGTHLGIVQNMLDYDFLAGRAPSVKAVFSSGGSKKNYKVLYGNQEMFIPTISDREEVKEFEGVDTLINLASYRSCMQVNKEAIRSGLFSHIFTIAEGVAEQETLELIRLAKQYDVAMFGPAIVGAMLVGSLRIGHTGGSLDNIVKSRLYQQGSIGIVTKSGGMMNELCRVVSKHTDGVHSAFQVGGDRFPLMPFEPIIEYFQTNDQIKIILLLGEVGNETEIAIADMIADGRITKPVVARCIGHAAEHLGSEVQFGHAGAKANSDRETAQFKNDYLRKAGAFVPTAFDDLGTLIGTVFTDHVDADYTIPEMDEAIAEKLHVLQTRRPTRFTATISDERGDELLYNGIPVSEFVAGGSLASVIGHLWLKKELPSYAKQFINTLLILLADHGPAVSGATNTIITARAGKDVVSSLIAGLATIGPRFGGAITGCASMLLQAVRADQSPQQFVSMMKKQGTLIQGIGHKVKSIYNPDVRCTLIREIAESFPAANFLEYGLAVEAITTQKKPNLILNVDGHIACLLLDMLVDVGYDYDEIEALIRADFFNAFFVLARSIGFIGHYLDQQRLQEGLYRTPWEDVWYGE